MLVCPACWVDPVSATGSEAELAGAHLLGHEGGAALAHERAAAGRALVEPDNDESHASRDPGTWPRTGLREAPGDAAHVAVESERLVQHQHARVRPDTVGREQLLKQHGAVRKQHLNLPSLQ
jgi:hypothetical protein